MVVPESEEEEEEKDVADEAEHVNEDSDSEGHLHGFSTDDDDSSDEDAMVDEPSEFDIGKLPTVAKDDATVKQKLEKAKQHPVSLFFSALFSAN
jgi:nucleolar protein 15